MNTDEPMKYEAYSEWFQFRNADGYTDVFLVPYSMQTKIYESLGEDGYKQLANLVINFGKKFKPDLMKLEKENIGSE